MSKKLTIEFIRELIELKGGKLLTLEYVNNHQPLDAVCSKGHLYHPTAKTIKRGGGCSICYNNTDSRRAAKAQPNKIQEVKDIANKRGGECLSNSYVNNREQMRFRCANGHEWETSFKSILHNAWCPECSKHTITNYKRKEKIQFAEKVAADLGGKLIKFDKDSFKNKFTWQCTFGHVWQATFQNVVYNNSWCPYCKSSYSESVCRSYLEYLLQCKFDKIRPEWLVSDKNRIMEIDGYNELLNLGFEHQGLQHYEKVNYFNSEGTQKRDIIKKQLCDEHNVKMIYIPALFFLLKIDELHIYIGKELNKLGIEFDKNKLIPVKDAINVREVKLMEYKRELEKIKEIIKNKGGECLSEIYSGYSCNIKCKCSKGHIWTTKAFAIKNDTWCPKCANASNLTIEDVKALTEKMNVECLENNYENNHSYLNLKCKKCNHEWKSTYNSLQYRKGCPVCSRIVGGQKRKLGIEIYQEVAVNKGGRCISTEVNSCYDKLEWECSKGHRWFGRADMIKNTKHWCPVCNNGSKNRNKS